MFRFSLWILIQKIKIKSLKTITVDIDATDADIYGKQEGFLKGYNPKKKTRNVFNCKYGLFCIIS